MSTFHANLHEAFEKKANPLQILQKQNILVLKENANLTESKTDGIIPRLQKQTEPRASLLHPEIQVYAQSYAGTWFRKSQKALYPSMAEREKKSTIANHFRMFCVDDIQNKP